MTDKLPELSTLHDAVLEGIRVDWQYAVVAIDLTRVPGGPIRLSCVGFDSFEMSRREEWGPSDYVNEAELRESEGRTRELWIEMQSGDVISLTGGRISVHTP